MQQPEFCSCLLHLHERTGRAGEAALMELAAQRLARGGNAPRQSPSLLRGRCPHSIVRAVHWSSHVHALIALLRMPTTIGFPILQQVDLSDVLTYGLTISVKSHANCPLGG
jgi:hypothetical protein